MISPALTPLTSVKPRFGKVSETAVRGFRQALEQGDVERANQIRETKINPNMEPNEIIPLQNLKPSHTLLGTINLSRTDLSNADLEGSLIGGSYLFETNLSGANLRNSNLINTNLSHANLTGADLAGANLTQSLLINTNLSHANLNKASLSYATLHEANLFNANLSGTNLQASNLGSANLRNTLVNRNTNVTDAATNHKTILPSTIQRDENGKLSILA